MQPVLTLAPASLEDSHADEDSDSGEDTEEGEGEVRFAVRLFFLLQALLDKIHRLQGRRLMPYNAAPLVATLRAASEALEARLGPS